MSLQTSIIDLENRVISLAMRVNSLENNPRRPTPDDRPPQIGPTAADLERELGIVKSDVLSVKDLLGATEAAIDSVKSSIKKHCAILETSIVQRFEKRYAEMIEKHAALAEERCEAAQNQSAPVQAAPTDAPQTAAASVPDPQEDDAIVLNPPKPVTKRKRDKQRKSE